MNVFVLTEKERSGSRGEELGIYSTLDLAKGRVAMRIRSIKFPDDATWFIAEHEVDSGRSYPVRIYTYKQNWEKWL